MPLVQIIALCVILRSAVGSTTPAHEAVSRWRRGADRDECNCCYRVAWAYATGTLVCEIDAKAALAWFERSSKAGNPRAASHLEVRLATPDTPCLFGGYDYSVGADRMDFPEISRMLARQRPKAAARSGTDELSGLSFAWRDIGV